MSNPDESITVTDFLGGLPSNLYESGQTPKENQPRAFALTLPNLANEIDDWCRTAWPELYSVPMIWFTGSKIWRFLYEFPEPSESDLDVFVVPERRMEYQTYRTAWDTKSGVEAISLVLANIVVSPPNFVERKITSLGGHIAWTVKGRVDYWCAPDQMAIHQIRNYPRATHGHCMAAYSPFYKMLLMGANPCADGAGALEMRERRMLQWGALEPAKPPTKSTQETNK